MKTTDMILSDLTSEQVEDLIWRYELQIRQATKRMEEAQTIVESKQALRFGLQAKTKLLTLRRVRAA